MALDRMWIGKHTSPPQARRCKRDRARRERRAARLACRRGDEIVVCRPPAGWDD